MKGLPAAAAQGAGRFLQGYVHVPESGADWQQHVGEAEDDQRKSRAGEAVDAGDPFHAKSPFQPALQDAARPQTHRDGEPHDVRRQCQRQHGRHPPETPEWQIRAHGEPGQRRGDDYAAHHYRAHKRHGTERHRERADPEDEVGRLRAGAQGAQDEINGRNEQQRRDQQGRRPRYGRRTGHALKQPAATEPQVNHPPGWPGYLGGE